MATKRLSRTVLEAGQWRFRGHYTKAAIRCERAEARVRVNTARRDPEHAEDLYVRPREPLGKWFARDKLGPVERWLHAQVGRPWAKVESEIRSRFDTRNLAGRHVVFDHLLPDGRWESTTGWRVHRRFEFSVDRHGILRARPRPRSSHEHVYVRPATARWIGDRRIGVHQNSDKQAAYWLIPVRMPEVVRKTDPRFSQAARLDASELERLAQLNAAEREAFVVALNHA